jgi:putative glutamine amidotransferase
VYFRGTLHQDLGAFYCEEPNPSSLFPVKEIAIAPGSKLASVLGVETLRINALHHQAVDTPGQGIVIVAREANGVVQAIESQQESFVIGVQWHPEYLPQHPEQRRLFQSLVQQAREVRTQIEEEDMQQALSRPRAEELESLSV